MPPLRKLALLAASAAAIGSAGQIYAQSPVQPSQPWAHVRSDLRADPEIRFGKLPNGMRYALRRNATPPGQVVLRLRIDAGSLVERDDQRGLAHFMEHMAFNGTKNIPENELTQILEREGLAFGADTNASTGHDQTVYMLNLPRNTDRSIDTALNVLREQVSEAIMAPAAIDAERGVIMGEQRLRNSPALRAQVALLQLIAPRLAARMPIGDMDVIRTAPRERFVDFYDRYYRPSRTTLIAVGDFDLDKMEAQVRRRFADWTPRGPDGVDIELARAAASSLRGVKIHVEPGVDPTLRLTWTRPADTSPDTRAKRRLDVLRSLGLAVLNERLGELSRSDAPPFRSAGAGRQDLAGVADLTGVTTSYNPGGLDAALTAVDREARRVVRYGITDAELQRQIGAFRNRWRTAVAGAATRPSDEQASEILSGVNDDEVVMSPPARSELFEEAVNGLTAAQVSAAMRPLLSGTDPLLLVTTPTAIPGGEPAVTRQLAAVRSRPITAPTREAELTWAYTDFGKPGAVASRRPIPTLAATVVTFANGTVLTVKPTKFTDGEILVSASTGIGELGMSADRVDPLYGAAAYLTPGGLGKLTSDQMARVLTGRAYQAQAEVEADRFIWRGATRPEDLALQMQVLAAFVTDPGLRAAPLERAKAAYASSIAQRASTPIGVFQNEFPGLIAGGDKRAAVATNEEFQRLDMAAVRPRLRYAIGRGPISVVMVGDLTVDQAIAATAATFGALPLRGAPIAFPPGSDTRRTPSGGDPVRLQHTGPADQALAYVSWPGPDQVEDRTEFRRVELLSKVLQIRALDQIREREALAYSPTVAHSGSPVYRGVGRLTVVAQTTPDKMPAFYAAVDRIVRDLHSRPVTPDELNRARTPLIEALPRTRATNEYWAEALQEVPAKQHFVEQAQNSAAEYQALTAADIQALARRYLRPEAAWRLMVTPTSLGNSNAAQTGGAR